MGFFIQAPARPPQALSEDSLESVDRYRKNVFAWPNELNSMSATTRCMKLMPACSPMAWTAPVKPLRILVNEASRIERAQHLQATPYERSAQRVDHANGYKTKTVLTRMGEVTFEVPQVRSGGFYPSALERGSRSEQAMNLALAERYRSGCLHAQSHRSFANAGGSRGQHLQHAS